MVITLALATAVAGVSLAVFQHPPVQDALLDKLVGKWEITRVHKNETEINVATCEWVLDHHFMRISMRDPKDKNGYQANVYITLNSVIKKYEIYWLDTFAGSLPGSIGYGHKKGDSIVFEWKDSDGTLRNTFEWKEDAKTWTSTIDQTDENGKWTNFAIDTYRKK